MSSFIADNACFAPLFEDPQISRLFSAEKTIEHCLAFEMALTEALGDHGLVTEDVAEQALDKMADFSPAAEALGQGSLADGVPVPEFVRLLKKHVGAELMPAVHMGATSQDLLDTALVLTLRDASAILVERMGVLAEKILMRYEEFGSKPMMGRTRMQAALPIMVADRIYTWLTPLVNHIEDLGPLRTKVEQLQFGGAVGTRHALGDKANDVAEQIADRFGLENPIKAWHTMRSPVVAYGDFLSQITGSLGKMGMDICLMAQQGVEEIQLSGSGSSSAMPHKQNPVLAETLVSFARFNAVQVSGLHHAMVHEQERSGMAWTLEWMILPLMVETTGKALLHADALIDQIETIGIGNG
ncbi:3-carboxy-cis,cis-muconate cycloisomerase [Cohaesibacter celericrescens]|uniref:3-carboxy-cis,cis-muconate cycloisomerase n=1 Tax=Cohaesibacter celericrescens TaxID=2067669 RepID=UPI003562A8AD